MNKEKIGGTVFVVSTAVAVEVIGTAVGLTLLPIVGIAAAIGGLGCGAYALGKEIQKNKNKKE